MLHDAILEGVEADDDQARPAPQVGDHVPQEALEALQLAIHPDAKGLERAGGRVDPLAPPRHDAPDDGGQLTGRPEGGAQPRRHNRAGHPARVTLLTVLVDDIRQFLLVARVEQVRGRGAARAVHAHVERLVAPEAEPTAVRVEL